MNNNLQKKRLEKVVIPPELPIAEAIPILDRAGMGILLLADKERKLLGIVTDGDIRRAMLRHLPFTEPSLNIASRNPQVAPPRITPSEALHLMDHGRSFVVNHLPLVDRRGRVVGLLVRRDLISEDNPVLQAVIMAGGFGSRLRPLTEDTPKPMLPIGDRPLIEHIIDNFRNAGIHRVNITTHFHPEKITDHFGDGRQFGVEINYVTEDRPLGTAGALGLMDTPHEPLLVMNGDILTRLDFRAMLDHHRKHQAALTMAVRQFEMQVPYGVVDSQGTTVNGVKEKPVFQYLVNAGIYLLDPVVYQYIPNGQRYDMTELIQKLIQSGHRVVSFPIIEYWLDIGKHGDYEQAQKDLQEKVLCK